MNKFSYENQGTNTFIVYTVAEEDTIDSMSLGMLTNNKIPGLASTLYTQIDAAKYIKYNISAKVSVSQFFAGVVNKKRLIGVFEGIADAMLAAEEYMIDVDTILLDMDYIFADVSTCETLLICLPLIAVEKQHTDLGLFFKNIMFSTQFDQTENCDYIAKIMNYLNSTPIFSMVSFKELLNQIKGNSVINNPSKNTQFSESQLVKQQVENIQPKSEHKQKINNIAQQKIGLQEPIVKTESQAKMQIPHNPAPNPAVAMPKPNVTINKEPTPSDDTEKISLFYLLQHYNKENAELYKAQKSAKKGSAKKSGDSNATKNKTVASTPATPFSIPGQSSATVPQTKQVLQPGQVKNQAPVQQTIQYVQPQVQVQVSPQQRQSQFQHQLQPQPSPQIPTGVQFQARPVQQNVGFGDTTVLMGAIGETTVLNATSTIVAEKPSPYLMRIKNNEKIPVDKPVFRIGKERSYVDYFVGDNTAISRSHANIVEREDKYFIVDTNSTNHTFVNGQMILSNTEVEITDGTKIRLANEDFEFNLR